MHLQAQAMPEPVTEGACERGIVHHVPGRGIGIQSSDSGAERIEAAHSGRRAREEGAEVEHLPARDTDAMSVSLKMVDEAEKSCSRAVQQVTCA